MLERCDEWGCQADGWIALRQAYERGEELQKRTRELASLQVGLINTVLQTLSMRDAMTARHSAAVARYSREVARMLGLSEREQMSAQCSVLESQYNGIIDGNSNAPQAGRAEGLHAQGVDACENNDSGIGAQKLEQAVRDLGVKPAA